MPLVTRTGPLSSVCVCFYKLLLLGVNFCIVLTTFASDQAPSELKKEKATQTHTHRREIIIHAFHGGKDRFLRLNLTTDRKISSLRSTPPTLHFECALVGGTGREKEPNHP